MTKRALQTARMFFTEPNGRYGETGDGQKVDRKEQSLCISRFSVPQQTCVEVNKIQQTSRIATKTN